MASRDKQSDTNGYNGNSNSNSGTGARRSGIGWMSKYTYSGKDRDESRQVVVSPPASPPAAPAVASTSARALPSTHSPTGGGGLPFYNRSLPVVTRDDPQYPYPNPYPYPYTYPSVTPTPTPTVVSPHPPSLSRGHRSSTSSLSHQELDQKASEIIMTAIQRSSSSGDIPSLPSLLPSRSSTSSFSRKSISAMMGSFSALSISRSNNDDKDKDKDKEKDKDKDEKRGRQQYQQFFFEKPRSSSANPNLSAPADDSTLELNRTRSVSPFRYNKRSRPRTRDSSPAIEALKQSDVESESENATSSRNFKSIRPRNNFSQAAVTSDDDSMDENENDVDDSELSEESWSDSDSFDPITQQNTEHNALIPAEPEPDGIEAPDPLGEGVNIIIPPEPYFPTTLNAGRRNPRRRKTKTYVSLPVETSRPIFKRDRCAITLTQGSPQQALETNGRRSRLYIVCSDLSEESRYAVEWGIGTVLRDGDKM